MNTLEQYGDLETFALLAADNLSEFVDDSIDQVCSSCFYGFVNLKKIEFTSAKNIQSYAFYHCQSLESVFLPSASSIGASAFYGCSYLKTVSLSSGVTIFNNAFHECYGLTESEFYPPIYTLSSINYIANQLLFSGSSYNFENIKYLNGFKMNQFSKVKNVSLPNIIGISDATFSQAKALETIAIGSSFNGNIAASAFGWCYKLSSFPSVYCSQLGSSAFYSCMNISRITLKMRPNANDNGKACYIQYDVFNNCYNLREVEFYLCSEMKQFRFLGQRNFSNCYKLERIIIDGESAEPPILSNNVSYFVSELTGFTNIFSGIYIKSSWLEQLSSIQGWSLVWEAMSSKIYNLDSMLPLSEINYITASLGDTSVEKSLVNCIIDSQITSLTSDMLSEYINLRSISCENLTRIAGNCFSQNKLLETVYFPNLDNISGFQIPTFLLKSATLGNSNTSVTIGMYNDFLFLNDGMYSMNAYYLSELTLCQSRITDNMLYRLQGLERLYLPYATSLCLPESLYALAELSTPNVTYLVQPPAITYYSNLKKLDFPKLESIYLSNTDVYRAFSNAFKLSQFIIRQSASVVTISISNQYYTNSAIYRAFGNYPLIFSNFYFYVPDNLYSSYLTNSYWEYYSSKIRPISQLPSE